MPGTGLVLRQKVPQPQLLETKFLTGQLLRCYWPIASLTAAVANSQQNGKILHPAH